MKASEVWWAVWYGLISALPLNVIALTLPSFCLLVAHSFVCLLMFVQLNGRGEQITGLIQLKISPAMPVLSFRGKNNPQKLCLWSSEYVHVFLVLFSFFCYHMGRSYLLEEFLERVLLWYFLLGFFFFFACSEYKWILLLYSIHLLSSSKVNATELLQVALIFMVMLLQQYYFLNLSSQTFFFPLYSCFNYLFYSPPIITVHLCPFPFVNL